jgi:phosphoribosylanthranilate isomerase
MKIKVCGMRDIDNAFELAQLPIDYMGFIFYDKSPRFINNRIDTKIIDLLDKRKIKKVGVFVNAILKDAIFLAEKNKLDVIQCHGDERPEYCNTLKDKGYKVFKAFRIDNGFDFSLLEKYENCCDYFLFDTSTKDFGGSGKKFDWDILNKYKNNKLIILSGGIGPGDEEATKQLRLNIYAVDLNSRFEIAPGVKDVVKIGVFIENIKNI